MFIFDVFMLSLAVLAIGFDIRMYIETEEKKFLALGIMVAIGVIITVLSTGVLVGNLFEKVSEIFQNCLTNR